MDQIMNFVEPAKQFAKDSIRLVNRCTKPDRKEFKKIAIATAIGFAIMGFIGFFVKLIHIPINNIIVGMPNNIFFGYMIGSKFNFIVSAAIFASTVYFLWIKIKKNSKFFKKHDSDSCIEGNKNNDTQFETQIMDEISQAHEVEIEEENIMELRTDECKSDDVIFTVIQNNESLEINGDNMEISAFEISRCHNIGENMSNVNKLDESMEQMLCNKFQTITISFDTHESVMVNDEDVKQINESDKITMVYGFGSSNANIETSNVIENIEETHIKEITEIDDASTLADEQIFVEKSDINNVSIVEVNIRNKLNLEYDEKEIKETDIGDEIICMEHEKIIETELKKESIIKEQVINESISEEQIDDLDYCAIIAERKYGEIIDKSILDQKQLEIGEEPKQMENTCASYLENDEKNHKQKLENNMSIFEREDGEISDESILDCENIYNENEVINTMDNISLSINEVDHPNLIQELCSKEETYKKEDGEIVKSILEQEIIQKHVEMQETVEIIDMENSRVIVIEREDGEILDESILEHIQFDEEKVGILETENCDVSNLESIETKEFQNENECVVEKKEGEIFDEILEKNQVINERKEILKIENSTALGIEIEKEFVYGSILKEGQLDKEVKKITETLFSKEKNVETTIESFKKQLTDMENEEITKKEIFKTKVSFSKSYLDLVDESVRSIEEPTSKNKNEITEKIDESVIEISDINLEEQIIEETHVIETAINGTENQENLIFEVEETFDKECSLGMADSVKQDIKMEMTMEANIAVDQRIANMIPTTDINEINNNLKDSIDSPSEELQMNKSDTKTSEEIDSSSDNSDYHNDTSLDSLMEYIDDCLNGKKSDHSGDIELNGKLENWPNDEDSLNNIKRDFYELSNNVCSPHPSTESDHAHCVNNLTERVAILSAESILDNQANLQSSDSERTPVLSSPSFDDFNPELYVEKVTYGDKELDIVYFDESVLEEGGVQTDVKIVRTIPVGQGGRIIGKKGKTKNELLKKFGAQLLIYNHPDDMGKQVLQITCNPSVKDQLERWVNKTLEQITKNTIQTTVSNPEWLKPMIPLGRLVPAHIIDMSTIQHVKLRIYDLEIIRSFNTMQREMNADYSSGDTTSILPRPVAIGCVCVAMIRPDYFVRAQIIEIIDDYAWVYLFDIGKVCQTYLFYLYKIREKYMRVPFQVIPARLSNAMTKNKNITPALIYKRFLCDQKTSKPKMVRVFFPRMNTCCEPCVNIYIPMSLVSDSNNNEEFVDLLELLVSMDVCSMVRETINPDIQMKINTNHFKAFLNEKDKKQSSTISVPLYFQPCNSKFYEDFIEFKVDTESAI